MGLDGARGRRYRAGRGQPHVHPRAHSDDAAALFVAADQGDAGRDDACRARARFGVADVRDVADVHILAMAAPEAAGKRYLALADGPTISFLEVATRSCAGGSARWRRGCRRRRRRGTSHHADHPQRPGPQGARMAPTARRDDDRRNGRELARPRAAGFPRTARPLTGNATVQPASYWRLVRSGMRTRGRARRCRRPRATARRQQS